MPRIVIVDYGMGNISNVRRGIEKAGSRVDTVTEQGGLRGADAIILPGVGAFRDAIANLSPFKPGILEGVESGVPLLGICLGLQLLFTQSTEGGLFSGLDVLRGSVLSLPEGLKVPQIGWNTVKVIDEESVLVKGLPDKFYAYFVHSYYARVEDVADVVAITRYGIDFPSIVSRKNVFATQFHPEKSGTRGLRILRNFVEFVKR